MISDYLDAARILLTQVEHDHALDLIDVETAGWLVGLHDKAPPPLPEPADTHARLAAALASDQVTTATALLHDRLSKPGMPRLLLHACHLGGHRHADALLEVVMAHQGVWFNGAMLAGTTRPQALLAQLDVSRGLPISIPDIVTIAELLLRGRDAGRPLPEAEAQWQALLDDADELARHGQFRTAHLRVAARGDLDAAVACLRHYAEAYPRSELLIGAVAVLARLLLTDPTAAVALVASADDEADLAAWLPALCWRFELPDGARPLIAALLESSDPETGLDLVTALARTPETDWLRRALHNTQGLEDRSERVVRAIAPAMMQLHAAGLSGRAEALLHLAADWLGEIRLFDGQLSATVLLRVLGAPGLPPLVPWGHGYALP